MREYRVASDGRKFRVPLRPSVHFPLRFSGEFVQPEFVDDLVLMLISSNIDFSCRKKGMSSFFGSSSSSTPAVSGTAAAAGTDPSRPFASYVSSS